MREPTITSKTAAVITTVSLQGQEIQPGHTKGITDTQNSENTPSHTGNRMTHALTFSIANRLPPVAEECPFSLSTSTAASCLTAFRASSAARLRGAGAAASVSCRRFRLELPSAQQ